MITSSDALTTVEFKDYFIILPNNTIYKNHFKKFISKGGKLCNSDFVYSSEKNEKFLTVSEIKKLIRDNLN